MILKHLSILDFYILLNRHTDCIVVWHKQKIFLFHNTTQWRKVTQQRFHTISNSLRQYMNVHQHVDVLGPGVL